MSFLWRLAQPDGAVLWVGSETDALPARVVWLV
jgi:hypothetical protein